jgi:diguanylate cyclase (GGDEF)-like protein/PAS domain S-box-containing protein
MINVNSLTRLNSVFDNMSVAILTLDIHANILYVNQAFENLFNYSCASLLNQHVSILVGQQHQNLFVKKSLMNITQTGHWSNEAQVNCANGDTSNCKIIVDTYKDDEGQLQGYIVAFHIVQKPAEDNTALTQLAYHDDLTGLANRALFNQLLSYQISQAEREEQKFALLFLDLDKFKQVNDNLGHNIGDILLCTVANRLEKSVRKSDVVARLGGDEFVIILNKYQDSDTVATIVEKIIREIKKPTEIGGHRVETGCSLGISLYPDNGRTIMQLLQHSDAAMYRAKQQGGNSYFYFSDELNKELLDFQSVREEIQLGLSNGEFVPYFQPLLDVKSEELVGIECLARWNHSKRGLTSPIEFIPVAKKAGLMHEILTQVLDVAFANLRDWKEQLGLSIPISVNMTSKQFREQKTFDKVDELLEKHGLTAEAIRVEVNESTLQESGDILIEELNKGNYSSFSITLDDFGTGYSSLKTLQQLPIDIIKIDRSFVRNLDNNSYDKIIVKAIIQMAHTLGIHAVAEGVETVKQKQFLLDNGCNIMQGYLFSHPLPANSFQQFITDY